MKISNQKPESRGKFRKSGSKCEDNIEIDIKEKLREGVR
jgi:hypothetical protein